MAKPDKNNKHGVEDLGIGTFRLNFISHKDRSAASKKILKERPFNMALGQETSDVMASQLAQMRPAEGSSAEGGRGLDPNAIQKGGVYWYRDRRDGVEKQVEVVAIDRSVQPPSFAIRAEGREGKTEAHRLSLDPSWGGKMMNVTVKVTENDSGRPVSDSRRNTSTPTGQTSQQSLLCEISYDMPADCGMMNPDLPVAMGGGNVPFLGPFLGQMVSGFGGGLEMGFGGGGSMGSAGHAQRYPLVQAPPSVYEQYLQKEREWGSAAAAQAGLNRQGHGSAFECHSGHGGMAGGGGGGVMGNMPFKGIPFPNALIPRYEPLSDGGGGWQRAFPRTFPRTNGERLRRRACNELRRRRRVHGIGGGHGWRRRWRRDGKYALQGHALS